MRNRQANSGLFQWLILITLLAAIHPLSLAAAEAATSRPRVGLVLGGGGARGMAHVGVLRLLEELRVPVDCVVGTSMGSIIGGLYAAGMTPAVMDQTLQQIDWPAAFADGPPRADLPFRVKEEQRALLTSTGIGLHGGKVKLPKGLLQGQNLLLLLEELALPAAHVHDFDQLPIPYRAVATDLETGEVVVLGSGDLAKAMRASMSIPSALSPIELDGKLLVDGGVANNVPVDVARQLCHPDVLIVVNVGAPMAKADELTSVLSITNQLTAILTERNVTAQIKTLGRNDILLVPDLKDITSINFERSPEAVTIGYATAEARRADLSRLSISSTDYQAHLAARPELPQTSNPVIDFIRINNNTRLSDQVIEKQLDIKPGEPLDPQKLNRNLNTIYGMGEFQEVNYSLVKEEGKTGLVVEARQRDVGTDTLRFGLFLGANMKGDSLFTISAAYTMSQLNEFGGEWRNFAQIGGDIALLTDFYQPLTARQDYFINPFLGHEQYNLLLSNGSDGVRTSFRVKRTTIGLEAGRNLERWGRLSLGLRYAVGQNEFRFGQPLEDTDDDFESGGYSITWATDTLDSLNFPTSGSLRSISFYQSLEALGADNEFQTLRINWSKPYTWHQFTLIPRVSLAGKLAGDLEIQDLFRLGGFVNLSGFQNGELTGEYAALGQVIAMYRLDSASAAFTIPLFAGGSLELGGVWNDVDDINLDSLIPAGSLFIGADTPLGPFYLAGGYAEGGNASLYLLLGKLF
ncbi:MAG: BamA/TamA family outer membrane protein [Synechococcaceae cyanobacterium SM1_2_3]|nr:BamA/TamA family outer membrane protein [Synechococcaceae cyanobacterium SM1_2_3]